MIEITEEVNDENLPFVFTPIYDAEFPVLKNKDIKANLSKWGFSDDMKLLRFKSDRALDGDNEQEFVNSFFSSDSVRQYLTSMTNVSVTSTDKLRVDYSKLSTQQTSLKMFRKLEENDIVMDCGRIRGRLEEDYEGVPIYDVLRESLYVEESEKFEVFSTQDRRELLFRVFMHVVTGGAANQYEDEVDAYLTATGLIYKDLVSVKKNDSGDLTVLSSVFEIKGISNGKVFSRTHQTNFCYLSYDPQTRHVTFWYFQHRPIW